MTDRENHRRTRQRVEKLARTLFDEGWQGSPLHVNGGQVVGGPLRYEAARLLGIEQEVPIVILQMTPASSSDRSVVPTSQDPV